MMPIVVDTYHPKSTSWHAVPHLQKHFRRPIVVSELHITVDGSGYNVYVSHKVGTPTGSTSEVVVMKRSCSGEYPVHIWDHDRVSVAIAIKA